MGAGGRKSQQDSSIFSIDYCGPSQGGNAGGRLATAGLDCTIRIWCTGDAERQEGGPDERLGELGGEGQGRTGERRKEEPTSSIRKLSPTTHLAAVMSRHTGKRMRLTLYSCMLLTVQHILIIFRSRLVRPLVAVGGHHGGSPNTSRSQPAMAISS